jgi:hypothetical protein
VNPVVSRNATCITVTGTQHIHIEGLEIAYCKGTGIEAGNTVHQPGGNAQLPGLVRNVTISGVHIHSIGGTGVDMRGRNSGIRDSNLHDIGCRGMVVHGGNATLLEPGHMFAINNTARNFAQYKRTYMSGIHWVSRHFRSYCCPSFRPVCPNFWRAGCHMTPLLPPQAATTSNKL